MFRYIFFLNSLLYSLIHSGNEAETLFKAKSLLT